MMNLLPSSQRGHENFGWLDSHHSFSFGEYYHPQRLGYQSIRAINEERIAGGTGFPSHFHQDVEIITYVIEGALQHKDTLGNSSLVRAGEVQILSAGKGVRQSESNALSDSDTHLLQFWLSPDRRGYQPNYQKKSFTEDFRTKSLMLVASPDGEDGSLRIRQDAWMHIGKLKGGEERRLMVKRGRHAWVQMIRGQMSVNGTDLSMCDGLALSEESELHFHSAAGSDFVLFDLC